MHVRRSQPLRNLAPAIPNVYLAVAADGDNTAVRKLLNVDASLPKPLPGWFYLSSPGATGQLHTRYDPLTGETVAL